MIHRIIIESDHRHEIPSISKELESVGVRGASELLTSQPDHRVDCVTMILDPLQGMRRFFSFPCEDLASIPLWGNTSTQNIFNSISIILNSND